MPPEHVSDVVSLLKIHSLDDIVHMTSYSRTHTCNVDGPEHSLAQEILGDRSLLLDDLLYVFHQYVVMIAVDYIFNW